VQVLGGKDLAFPPRCASFAGYSLHAGVGFKATDRAGLERLCRCILRPPPESPEAAKARRAKRLTRHPRMRLAGERPSWSDLLERVFRVDGFARPDGTGGGLDDGEGQVRRWRDAGFIFPIRRGRGFHAGADLYQRMTEGCGRRQGRVRHPTLENARRRH
jgi:hypothetical protein